MDSRPENFKKAFFPRKVWSKHTSQPRIKCVLDSLIENQKKLKSKETKNIVFLKRVSP